VLSILIEGTADPSAALRSGRDDKRGGGASIAQLLNEQLRNGSGPFAGPYLVPGGASNLVTLQMFLQYSWIARSEENLPIRAAL
jgi:hypothetical protein